MPTSPHSYSRTRKRTETRRRRSADDELVVLSVNLANNVFRNRVDGTEQRVVKRCQTKYGNSKWCTHNVATFMASQGVHLLGLQECQNVDVFCKWMQSALPKASPVAFRTVSETVNGTQATSALVYDRARMGPHESIAMPHFAGPFGPQYNDQVRSVAAAYFQQNQLVFASVWLNHLDQNHVAPVLKDLLTRILAVNADKPVRRMIVAMDSNDCTGSLKGFTYVVKSGGAATPLTLRLIGQPYTCCDDNEYTLPGDYILDTAEGHETALAPVPTALASYMSDHLPVRLQRRREPLPKTAVTAAMKKGAATAKKTAAAKKKDSEWRVKHRACTQKMRLRCRKKGRVFVARTNECRDKKRPGRPPNPQKAACLAAGRVWVAKTCRDRRLGRTTGSTNQRTPKK